MSANRLVRKGGGHGRVLGLGGKRRQRACLCATTRSAGVRTEPAYNENGSRRDDDDHHDGRVDGKASKERCYAITCTAVLDDRVGNGEHLLQTFRGHWTVEAKNHYRRDVTYQEDRSPVKNHNAARVLATMKMVAIFLCQIEAHRPQSDRERSLPEFNRACAINGIDTALNWMTRKYNPLGR